MKEYLRNTWIKYTPKPSENYKTEERHQIMADNNQKDQDINISIKTVKYKKSEHSIFLRIFAIIGLLAIVGLYILSLVAALSDWENSFGIFTGALAATIFVPIVIYLFRLFSKKDD